MLELFVCLGYKYSFDDTDSVHYRAESVRERKSFPLRISTVGLASNARLVSCRILLLVSKVPRSLVSNQAHLVHMLSLNPPTIGTGVALGILITAYLLLRKRNERLPPGPPRYPIIGNVLNFPIQGWAQIFPEWHKKYGTHKL